MANYMRNKRTGEIREVEPDSAEFADLKAEVGPDSFPVWEQTGQHHAEAIEARREAGDVREDDRGLDDQVAGPVVEYEEPTEPDPTPSQALTPGEVEMGMDPDQKAKELADQFGTPKTVATPVTGTPPRRDLKEKDAKDRVKRGGGRRRGEKSKSAQADSSAGGGSGAGGGE